MLAGGTAGPASAASDRRKWTVGIRCREVVPAGRSELSRRRLWKAARPFLTATVVVAAAAAIAPILQRLPHANLSLLFMTGVLVVAVRHGLWPSIYASLLSFLIFNFFFTAPLYTFKVSEQGDVATLVFFLLMASLSGNLAARMREAMVKREAAKRQTELLQAFTRKAAGAATDEQVLQILADHLADTFGCNAVAVTVEHGGGRTSSVRSRQWTGGLPPDAASLTDGPTKLSGWTSLPLDSVRGRLGAVAINQNVLTREEREHAVALISQAAVALERTLLVADLEEAKLVSEREQLRVALLSSVSHDLRTPLSSIIGAASSLAAYKTSLSADAKDVLLQSIVDESERLDRYIQNLLDMTRLGQGDIQLRCDWEDVRDLVSAASRRLRLAERGLRLETEIAEDAQFIYAHGDLIEQAIANLLDNAMRFSPPGGTIHVATQSAGTMVHIEVSDEGPGIPEHDRERVFDPFYRVLDSDRKSGTGLGLSICRGIAHAHGGEASAHAKATGTGALLRLSIRQNPDTGGDHERA
jgi:two-component system, OmpR family, sensor histidine kinase KdpD